MAYTTAEGRHQVLSDVAAATSELAVALAALTEAYEALDDDTADRLEEALFRPVGAAYGLARRTASEFASRHSLGGLGGEPAGQPLPRSPGEAIRAAAQSLQAADAILAELQDSMLPVEVGDPELRAGLSHVRELIGPLGGRSTTLLRTLGR